MIRVAPFSALSLALLLALTPGGRAQEVKDAPPPPTASLVPVGSNSDAYWVGDGPNMRAIALDPGAAPPATLTVRTRTGLVTIPTILNRPSIALAASGDKLKVFANAEPGQNGDPPVFGEYQLSNIPGHHDIFLNRSPKNKDWQEAESLVLRAGKDVFPDGSFRVINLCHEPIAVRIGADQLTVEPRRARIQRPASLPNRPIPLQAARKDGNNVQWILRSGMSLDATQRANLVFYPGRESKTPCQATTYYQFDPAPLEPKEK